MDCFMNLLRYTLTMAAVLVAGTLAATALAGTLSFCPTLILSVLRLLAARMALGVVPNWVAILVKVSPDLTE